MSATLRSLDTASRVSPIGLRFWDPVTGSDVTDGLALGVLGADPPAMVGISPSGVYVLSNLVGLAASEHGAGDAAYWASPPETAAILVTVADTLGRYLPYSMRLDAPTHGLAAPACVAALAPWLQASRTTLPLFASAAQSFPAGIACVRAWLWDAIADAPAAGAVVAVESAGVTATGLADQDGRVLVALPYPPLPSGIGSPPGGYAVTAQQWPVSVTVNYEPALTASGPPGFPDLCALLAQAPAQVLAEQSPPTPLGSSSLLYGVDLVLESDQLPYLLVDPAPAPSASTP